MNTLKKYDSIDQVELKNNQVLIKPIKPILEKGIIRGKWKAALANTVLVASFGLSVVLLLQESNLRILGSFILGLVLTYAVFQIARKK